MPAPLSIFTSSPPGSLRSVPQGVAGTSVFAGQVDDFLDENPKTSGRRRWCGQPGLVGEGHKMVLDAHVGRSQDALVDPVVGATWDFEAADREPQNMEVADFCRRVFFELLDWSDRTELAQRSYIRDGFALFEQTDRVIDVPKNRFPNHPGHGKGIGFDLHYRPAWSVYSWGQSKRNPTQLDHVEQWTSGSDGEAAGVYRIDADRLIRFTWQPDGANFEGNPILRRAWGPWFVKRMLTRVEAQGHEKNHIGLPFVTPPEGVDLDDIELKKIIKMMSEFRAHERGCFTFPGGYNVDFKSGSANTPIQSTIDRLNLDIAINVAAPFMLLGSKGTSGSYALASTQEGQFRITLDKHARFICNVFNCGQDGWSLVERIVRLNYGNVPVPRMVVRNMPTVNWQAVLPMLIDAKKAGIIKADRMLDQFFRSVTFAPEADEETQDVYAQVQPMPNVAASTEPGQQVIQEAPSVEE